MNKPLVVVTAPVATRSGYGNHARDICRALIESDKYDLRIQSVRWGNTPPNALEDDNPHHKEIKKRIPSNNSVKLAKPNTLLYSRMLDEKTQRREYDCLAHWKGQPRQ